MRGLMRRVAVVAGGLVVLGGATAGVASAKVAPAVLAFSPSPHSYGSVNAGKKASQVFTLTNSGGTASRALTLSLSGSTAFAITKDPCQGKSLKPGKSCTVAVSFAPTGAGAVTATLTATGVKATVTATESLSGTGVVPGHIYWTDQPGDYFTSINEAGRDGSNQVTLSDDQFVSGLAVDSSHLFWSVSGQTDQANGEIMEAGLDGSNPQALITGVDNPNGVVVHGGHIYWADPQQGTIMEAGLDGSNPQALITDQSGLLQLAVGEGHIYWTDESAGTIMEADLDGTDVTTIVTGQTNLGGPAVSGGHIYWTGTARVDGLPEGTIMEADLDGSNPQTLVSIPGYGIPGSVTVVGGDLYYVMGYPFTGGGEITEAGLDGSDPQILAGSMDGVGWLAVSSH